MLDEIFNALFSIADTTGTAAGTENKSTFFKILGCAVWVMLLVGIIGLIIYWFS